jgi:hypothetical protein
VTHIILIVCSLIVGVKKRNFDITDDWQADGRRPESMGHRSTRLSNVTSPGGRPVSVGKSKKRYTAFNAKSVSGPATYFMGIVDFLQDWSTKKKLERAGKIYLYRQEPGGISVMEPGSYCHRFQDKMDVIFDVPDEVDPDEERDSFSVSAHSTPSKSSSTPGDKRTPSPGTSKVSMRRSSSGNAVTVGFHQRGGHLEHSPSQDEEDGGDESVQFRKPLSNPLTHPVKGKVAVFEHMEADGGTMNAMHK